MNDRQKKIAYIGAAATVLAAIIAGLFTLFASPTINTEGDCSSIITGEVNSNITLNCSKEN